MKLFAITGVAGYIAPRHLQAIKDTGNTLIAAMDPHDSVGILDRYSQEVAFFTEFERFDRHLERMRQSKDKNGIDYLSICTPNYLHDAHIRLALRLGASAICEKPLVTNPWQLDALQDQEEESAGNVYGILQLRVHESMLALKKKIESEPKTHKRNVSLTYITSRGKWYKYSWKGNHDKSGGIAANIGIHFFDILIWLFGGVESSKVHLNEPEKMSGFLELKHANVKWYLSIDKSDLPEEAVLAKKPTYRSIKIDQEEIEFSTGFTDLHTRMYEVILAGDGFTMADVRPSIELVHNIQTAKIDEKQEEIHPIMMKHI